MRSSLREREVTRPHHASTRPINSAADPKPLASLVPALGVFIVAAVIHISAVMVVHWGTGGAPLSPDEQGYESRSLEIADLWQSHGVPQPEQIAAIVGSQIWGFPAFMAFCRVLAGGGWLEAKVVLAAFSATGAVAAYGLAVVSRCTRQRAMLAGLVVGVSPTLLLWDAWGLKDGFLTTLVLWVLLLQARSPFWLASIGTVIGIQACLYLRPAAALFLGIAFLAGIRLRRGHVVGWFIAAALAAFFVLPRAASLFGGVGFLEIDKGTPLTFDGGPSSVNLMLHPQYLAKFLLAPFPWAFGPGTAGPERWLYLGTILWIALLALAPATMRRAWADTSGFGRRAILGSVGYAATYFLSFGADFCRQRSLLECMLLIMVVLYLRTSRAAAVARVQIWLGLVATIAAVQSSDLTPEPTSKVLFLALNLTLVVVAIADPVPRLARWRSDRQPRSNPGS
jgi:hypothetical protein